MKRLGSPICLLVCLPQLWLAVFAVLVALAGDNWEALRDIIRFALERLAY
jgi:hypothetical protein